MRGPDRPRPLAEEPPRFIASPVGPAARGGRGRSREGTLRSICAVLPLLLAAACADSTSGPPPGTRNVILATVADGVSGSALLAAGSGGPSTVWVTLQGLAPGVTYTGWVSRGSCQNPGAVVVTLAGMSTTTTAGSAITREVPDSVLAAGFHIVYAKPGLPPPPVACGNTD